MITLAISTFHHRISPRFDCSESVLVITIEDGVELSRESFHLLPRLKRAALEKLGVTDLICGGLSDDCARLLQGSTIRVHPWKQGDVEDVLAQFLHDLHVAEPAH